MTSLYEIWPLGVVPEVPGGSESIWSRELHELDTETRGLLASKLSECLQIESIENRAFRQTKIGHLFPELRDDETLRWLGLRERNLAAQAGYRSWKDIAGLAVEDVAHWRNAGRKAVANILFGAAMLSVDLAVENGGAWERVSTETAVPVRRSIGEAPSATEASCYEELPLLDLLDLAADEVLKGREREMWHLRYGASRQSTLSEIGEQYGVSRERVRQILGGTERAIRHGARSNRHACIALGRKLAALEHSFPAEYEEFFHLAENELSHLPLSSASSLLLALGGHPVPPDIAGASRQWRIDRAAAQPRDHAQSRSEAVLSPLPPNAYSPTATPRLSDLSGEVIAAGTGARLTIHVDDAETPLIIAADLTSDEAGRIAAVIKELGGNLEELCEPPPPKRSPHGPNREAKTLDEIRRTYPSAYRSWGARDDQLLTSMFRDGRTVSEIASTLGRQPGGITSRLAKLGLTDRTPIDRTLPF